MAHVQLQSPDRPDNDRPIQIQRVVDTVKSDAHVSQLLAIANHSMQLLATPAGFDDRVETEPEAVKTALSTFQLAHLKIRDLIDETRRWSLEPSPDEKAYASLMESTLKLYETKTEQAATHNRPCIFLRPKIARFEVGWVVWMGDGMPLKSHLHGVGSSPEKAMEAFDSAYRAEEKIADDQPAAPPPAPSAAPKPRRKKQT